MKKLSSGARALLEQYRDESEIHDHPDPLVLERIESSIEQEGAVSRRAPPRAAAWMAWGALAAASVATLWVWTSRAELRVIAPSPVSTAVDRIIGQVEQTPRRPPDTAPVAPLIAPPVRPPSDVPSALTPRPRERSEAVEPKIQAPDDSLQRELEMLRQAREALREGRSAGAKASLRAHALAYPQGQLAEEREALLVVVRCIGGEANTGRLAFERSHPGSHHLPSIRVACEGKKNDEAVTDEEGGGQ